MPLFAEGGLSPLDTGLDVIVGAILIKLLGWHWAFLPTFAAELVPGLDLFPTWTAAVFFATRQLNSSPEQDAIDHDRKRTTEPEILDPGPRRQEGDKDDITAHKEPEREFPGSLFMERAPQGAAHIPYVHWAAGLGYFQQTWTRLL